jgi:hypothetical protein
MLFLTVFRQPNLNTNADLAEEIRNRPELQRYLADEVSFKELRDLFFLI